MEAPEALGCELPQFPALSSYRHGHLPSVSSGFSSLIPSLPVYDSQPDPSYFLLLLNDLIHMASGCTHSRDFQSWGFFQMFACLWPLPPQHTGTELTWPPIKITTAVNCGHQWGRWILKCAGMDRWLRNANNSTSSFAIYMPCIFFTCLITLARTSNTLLRSGRRQDIPALVLILGVGKHSVFYQ